LKADLADRQKKRIKCVLVPGTVKELNMTDKDGNSVYRCVAYKS